MSINDVPKRMLRTKGPLVVEAKPGEKPTFSEETLLDAAELLARQERNANFRAALANARAARQERVANLRAALANVRANARKGESDAIEKNRAADDEDDFCRDWSSM